MGERVIGIGWERRWQQGGQGQNQTHVIKEKAWFN